MALHLLKLCVGCQSPQELAAWQKARLAAGNRLIHRTRNMPRRAAECEGGSLYWIFKGVIAARQGIEALARGVNAEGGTYCDIHLASVLVATAPTRHRPFQGWRYLEAEDAPPDLDAGAGEDSGPLETELRRLGLV